MCNCTAGWVGDHCQIDEDSCEGDPCFDGVICYDDPPPSTTPRCGKCPTSYTGNGMTCYDIDECLNSTSNNCQQLCHNTLGSYECSCMEGFDRAIDRQSCNDIDECAVDSHDCGENSICMNLPGTYNCSCEEGYLPITEDGNTCADIDECLEFDVCSTNSFCVNSEGSFTCICTEGYVSDGDTCSDENECQDPTLNDCDNQATCTNLDGYYTCTCKAGWIGNGFNCTDVDECTAGTDDCSLNANCTNAIGSYRCECQDGYTGNGVMCFDIDECADASLHTCPSGSECRNLNGSYSCPCMNGYSRTVDGMCEDINECLSALCASNASCTNTNGSFVCQCNEYYQGDGLSCTDINECNLRLDDCPQICINTEPGFTCGCHDGFTLNADRTCEVSADSLCSENPCGANAVCAVIDGTGTCFCNQTGFELVNNMTCQDVNECETSFLCETFCNNTEGSFICSCSDGFTLDSNLRNCTDIDECAESRTCAMNAECTNTEGGYICECQAGYDSNGTANSRGSCSNINECTSSAPCGVNARCADTEGSFTCTCLDGFTGDGQNCADVNECLDTPCDRNADCVNTPASYNCTCRDGYSGNGTTCTNMNECDLPTSCAENATCVDRDGAYSCSCYAGFRGDAFTRCDNIDECGESPRICHRAASCQDIPGSYKCVCNEGFEGNGTLCNDINECEGLPQYCGPYANCTNTVGSARCTCIEGFVDDNGNCTDYDECDNNLDSCQDDISVCVNEHGDYRCECNGGYSNTDPKACKDINECKTGNDNCGQMINTACVNTIGSFRCDCVEMFTDVDGDCTNAFTAFLSVRFSTIGGLSVGRFPDVIETEQSQRELSSDAVLQLRNSAFGDNVLHISVYNYTLEGSQMTVTFRVDLDNATRPTTDDLENEFLSGLTPNVNRLEPDNVVIVADVNECEVFPEICGNGDCENTDGSYYCECSSGYSGNGDSCSDVNECINGNNNCSQRCVNEDGGFTCYCFEGYTINDDQISCTDIDECSGEHGCQHFCSNTNGSHVCECNEGFQLDNDARNCSDINECLRNHRCEHNCSNTEGSYYCFCDVGYLLTNDNMTCSALATASASRSVIETVSRSSGDIHITSVVNVPATTSRPMISSVDVAILVSSSLSVGVVSTETSVRPSGDIYSTSLVSVASSHIVSTMSIDMEDRMSTSTVETVHASIVTSTPSMIGSSTLGPAQTITSSMVSMSPTVFLTEPPTTPMMCPSGTILRNNVCTVIKRLKGSLTITNIDGRPAFVTNELLDPHSAAFNAFEAGLRDAFIRTTGIKRKYLDFRVLDIRNGSIVATLSIEVFTNTSEEASSIVQTVNTTDLSQLEGENTTFTTESFSLEEIGTTPFVTSSATIAFSRSPVIDLSVGTLATPLSKVSSVMPYQTSQILQTPTIDHLLSTPSMTSSVNVRPSTDKHMAESTSISSTMLSMASSTRFVSASISSANPTPTPSDTAVSTTSDPCPDGSTLRGNICRVFERLSIRMTISHVDGTQAFLTDGLGNQGSAEFMAFQSSLRDALISHTGIDSGDIEVIVEDLIDGSIITALRVDVYGNTAHDVANLVQIVRSTDFSTLTDGSTTFTVISITVNGETLNQPAGGLSTGAVIGIAMGCFSIVLILFILGICYLFMVYARERQAAKLLRSMAGSKTPSATNHGYLPSGPTDDHSFVEQRGVFARRALARIQHEHHSLRAWDDINPRRPQYPIVPSPKTFSAPYVVDGSEATYMSKRTHVERNPVYDERR